MDVKIVGTIGNYLVKHRCTVDLPIQNRSIYKSFCFYFQLYFIIFGTKVHIKIEYIFNEINYN